MPTEWLPDEPAVAPVVDPGHCNKHGAVLVTSSRAGLRSSAWHAEAAVWCPFPVGHEDESPVTRARCRFCGGRLVPAGSGAWSFRGSRAYCSPTHRNYYWRWLKRHAADVSRRLR